MKKCKSHNRRQVQHALEVARFPHQLDKALSCPRCYMHLLKLGLSPTEYQVNTNSKGRPAAEKLGLPPANVIGSIFHRVVEIGLQTPKIEFELSTPLPTQWTQPSPDLLADDEVIKSVLKELMPPDADADALRTLLKQMSEAVKQGPLGTLTSGASWNKERVEGCVRSGHSVYRFRWSSMLARSCGLHTVLNQYPILTSLCFQYRVSLIWFFVLRWTMERAPSELWT